MPVADKNGTAKIMKRKLIRTPPPVFGVERFDILLFTAPKW